MTASGNHQSYMKCQYVRSSETHSMYIDTPTSIKSTLGLVWTEPYWNTTQTEYISLSCYNSKTITTSLNSGHLWDRPTCSDQRGGLISEVHNTVHIPYVCMYVYVFTIAETVDTVQVASFQRYAFNTVHTFLHHMRVRGRD